MHFKARKRVRWLSRVLDPKDYERIQQIQIRSTGFGYDAFGLEPESIMLAYGAAKLFYEHWFRVESRGIEHVPTEGPVLLVANHSGGIPIDAFMIAIDLIRKLDKPRIMRSVVYNRAGYIPFVNTFFSRVGQIAGARRNIEELLKREELVAIFPEGAKGPWKEFGQRYRLQPFNIGFMELSLRYRTPIVPMAVIGAEEQYPFMTNLKPLARMFKLPFFPLTPFFPMLGPLGMLPLPTKYHLLYGEPFHFYRDHPPETVRSPEKVRDLVEQVRGRVEVLIAEGLRSRNGVFGLASLPLSRLIPSGSRPGRTRGT